MAIGCHPESRVPTALATAFHIVSVASCQPRPTAHRPPPTVRRPPSAVRSAIRAGDSSMPVDTSPAYKNRDRLVRYRLHHGVLADEGSQQAQRYHGNRLASPLLRLPYELRLQIYQLVLGDRQIHIRFVPCPLKRPPLKPSKAAAQHEPAKGRFRHEVLPYKQNPWTPAAAAAAAAASSPPGGRLTLLSGVCRQLHHETALLPLRLNAWSFESTRVMERFVLTEARLALPQRRAVAVLYCRDRLPRALRNKFKGLQVVVWSDGDHLRWQELDVFPDVAWRDRAELLERSWRWSAGGRRSRFLLAAQGPQRGGC